jgi:methylmalonyl-CoA epimerase
MNTPGIDHIGIAVRDLDKAGEIFSKLLGVRESHRERVEQEGVEISVFQTRGTRIELLSPLDEKSPIARFLERRGPGIHHIAIERPDIHEHAAHLSGHGFSLIGGVRTGGEGREVFFVDPKETSGVLLEFTSPPSSGRMRV